MYILMDTIIIFIVNLYDDLVFSVTLVVLNCFKDYIFGHVNDYIFDMVFFYYFKLIIAHSVPGYLSSVKTYLFTSILNR